MTRKTFQALEVGDIVRHTGTDLTYLVTGNYGDHVSAVRAVDMTHPNEWEVVIKSRLESPGWTER